MSTPTTVRFQIEVPTDDGNGCTTNTHYSLTLTLQVEGPADGEIRVSLLPDEPPTMVEPDPQAPGAAPMPSDPPN